MGRRDAAGTLLGMGIAPQPADDSTKRKRSKSATDDWFCTCGDKYEEEDDNAGMWIECDSCYQHFCPKKE